MREPDTLRTAWRAGLPGFLLLFAALYGGYGALSPFLPAFLKDRGFSPQEIATFLAAALSIRLIAGPLAGRHADRHHAVRRVLVIALGVSGGVSVALFAEHGFWPLLAIGLVLAASTAPLAPLADTLALAAAEGARAFEYGWVRAAGSAAFIAATVLTGYLVGAHGSASGLLVAGASFGIAALIGAGIRQHEAREDEVGPPDAAPTSLRVGLHGRAGAEFRELAANPRFRRLVLAAALVIGAHAMHDTFAMIAWREAGIDARIAGWLWSESVAAEIIVFLWAGPRLLARLGPARAIELAALAGMVRWAVQGQTSALPALIGIQCLHGLTFALLHLACLAVIEQAVPERIRATALTVYGNLALGLASALLTLAAGTLYAGLGLHAFWVMSALSLAAVPVAMSLRADPGDQR